MAFLAKYTQKCYVQIENERKTTQNPSSQLLLNDSIPDTLFPKMYSIHSHFVQKGVQPVEGITSRNLTHLLENMKQCKYLSNAHRLVRWRNGAFKGFKRPWYKESSTGITCASMPLYFCTISQCQELGCVAVFPRKYNLACFSDDDETGKKRVKKKLLLFGEFCEGENAHTTVGFTFSVRFFSDTSRTVSSMS